MSISRRTLIERIDRFIGRMEKAHREPDEWEGQCIVQALTDIADGDLPHAETMMTFAKMAPDQRTSERPPGLSIINPRPRVAELKAQLVNAKQDRVPRIGS